MSTRLVTVQKGSSDFLAYLLGTFSASERALPLQTLNANTAAETVTFQIVSAQNIQRPGVVSFLSQTLKFKNLLFVFFPLFLVLCKIVSDDLAFDSVAAILSTCGVLSAFLGLSLRNDYLDHLQGVDRVVSSRGSRAIQKGWLTAVQVKRLSLCFLLISLLMAVPLGIAYPAALVVLAFGVMAGLFAYQIGGEWSLFLLLGPLLTVGYQLSMGLAYDQESLFLGGLWGWLVLYLNHLRNFTAIVPSSQAGFRNTVNYWGFDKARRGIALWWLTFTVGYAVYHVLHANLFWGVLGTALFLLSSLRFVMRLKKLASPVGSEMSKTYEEGRRLFQIAVIWWALENLWYVIA